jgi:hypothetical protein
MRAFYIYLVAVFACGGDSTAVTDAGVDADASDVVPCRCIDAAPPAANSITILNASGTSIVTFAGDANGDVAPLDSIAGDQTSLQSASALAIDASGNEYVATLNAILVFAAGATGNVAPTRTIAGPTALPATDTFVALAVMTDGTIFAASELASGANRDPKILVFAPNANGDVAPTRVITGASTTMQSVLSMSVFFTEIAVADASQRVLFFHPSDSGDVAPVRAIGDTPGVVVASAFDSISSLFLARYDPQSSSVISFIAGANGNPTPLSNLAGDATTLTAPAGVAIDIGNNLYVANADRAGASILVFSADGANGNVAPIRVISGPSTTLTGDVSQFPMPIVVR